MKKYIVCLFTSLLALSASAQSKMSLKGEGETLKEGEKLYLYAGGQTPADSTYVKDGKFEFSLKGIEPRECCLFRPEMENTPNMLVYLDDCPTYIVMKPTVYSAYSNVFIDADVSGNPIHNVVNEVNDFFFKTDASPLGSSELKAKLIEVARRHDLASAYVCNKYLSMYTEMGIMSEVGASLKQMSQKVRESVAGRELSGRYELLASLDIGATVKDFSIANREGKTVSLLDYVNGKKLVLIDFWASWCGPCREEGKNVKAIYDDYHAGGFDVLGVSLDNKREAWEKAIGEEGYSWEQLCDFQGFKSPVCQSYQVNGIPALFLIDGEGKIVAKNLRGEDLRNKVAEYCK